MALTEDQVNFFDLGLFDKSFAEQFDKLVDGKPAWCAIKNAEIAVGAGRVPDTVIVDVRASQPFYPSAGLTAFEAVCPRPAITRP